MDHQLPQLALLGISGYAQSYLRWLDSAQESVALRAAVVVNQEQEVEMCRRLRARGVVIYDDWRELFAEWRGKLDLCLIPIPIHLHAQAAIAALEAGANVLVEKPLAASIAQVEAIREAERRTGRWAAVGYQDFYRPSTHAIRRDLDAGRIGRVKRITWTGFWPRGDAYYKRNNWAGRLTMAGMPLRDSPLNNALAHFLNLSLFWAGAGSASAAMPLRVEAELFQCYPIESFDTAVLQIFCDTGVRIDAAVTHCCRVQHPVCLTIEGEQGELMWVHREKAVWSDGEVIPLETYTPWLSRQFAVVLDRLTNPRARICTTADALSQVQCVELLHSRHPIQSVSPHFWEEHRFEGSPCRAISGIEVDLLACVKEGVFPSELAFPWATGILQAGMLTPLRTTAA